MQYVCLYTISRSRWNGSSSLYTDVCRVAVWVGLILSFRGLPRNSSSRWFYHLGNEKWNESGFRPPLCTYRLNWARRTSWGWWDDWDDTVLQTQDSKFEPWRSEAEHATSRSRRLPTILTFTRGWGRNIFCFFQTAKTGNRTPNSGVKGSGANHYPRTPALYHLGIKSSFIFAVSYVLISSHGWVTKYKRLTLAIFFVPARLDLLLLQDRQYLLLTHYMDIPSILSSIYYPHYYKSRPLFSDKLRYDVGFRLVAISIATNPKPTIYRNLYENTACLRHIRKSLS